MAITRLSPLARKPYKFKPFKVRAPATPAGILNIVATATSTAATIVVPTSVVAGDVLVLGDRAENSSATTPTTVLATGFTSINNVFDTDTRQIVSYKLADGTEAGTTLTGMDGTDVDRKVLYVLRSRPVITAVSVQDVDGVISNGDPAAQTITSGSGTPPLAVFGVFGTASGSAASNTFVPGPPDQTLSSSTNFRMSVELMDIFSYNVVVDKGSDDIGDALQSFYLQFNLTPAVIGVAALTEAGDTLASAAAIAIAGVLASTEANDTLSSASKIDIAAAFAITESNDTLASTGKIDIAAAFARTEANDTSTSTAAIAIAANFNKTEENDTLAATSTASFNGNLSVTEANDTLVSDSTFLDRTPGIWREESGDTKSWTEPLPNTNTWTEASSNPGSWAELSTKTNSWTEEGMESNGWTEELP